MPYNQARRMVTYELLFPLVDMCEQCVCTGHKRESAAIPENR